MSEIAKVVGPDGKLGPHHDEKTGETTHWGPHSTQIYLPGQVLVKIAHGESVMIPKDGSPAVIFRVRGN